MTQAEIEKWQQKNTFYCQRLHARITPEQCDENRNQGKGSWGASGGFKRACITCQECADYKALKATVTGQTTTKKKGKKKVAKRGNCACCGRGPYALQPKRLCAKCYKALKSGDLAMDSAGNFVWVGDTPEYYLEAKRAAQQERGEVGDMIKAAQQELDKEKLHQPKKECKPKPTPPVKPTSPANVLKIKGYQLERHTRHRHIKPIASIRFSTRSCDINLNAAAVELGFSDATHIDVYKDRTAKVLAIKPLTSPTDNDSIPLRGGKDKHRTSRVFSAGTIAKDLGVTESGRFELEPTEDGFFLICLANQEAA